MEEKILKLITMPRSIKLSCEESEKEAAKEITSHVMDAIDNEIKSYKRKPT